MHVVRTSISNEIVVDMFHILKGSWVASSLQSNFVRLITSIVLRQASLEVVPPATITLLLCVRAPVPTSSYLTNE